MIARATPPLPIRPRAHANSKKGRIDELSPGPRNRNPSRNSLLQCPRGNGRVREEKEGVGTAAAHQPALPAPPAASNDGAPAGPVPPGKPAACFISCFAKRHGCCAVRRNVPACRDAVSSRPAFIRSPSSAAQNLQQPANICERGRTAARRARVPA